MARTQQKGRRGPLASLAPLRVYRPPIEELRAKRDDLVESMQQVIDDLNRYYVELMETEDKDRSDLLSNRFFAARDAKEILDETLRLIGYEEREVLEFFRRLVRSMEKYGNHIGACRDAMLQKAMDGHTDWDPGEACRCGWYSQLSEYRQRGGLNPDGSHPYDEEEAEEI